MCASCKSAQPPINLIPRLTRSTLRGLVGELALAGKVTLRVNSNRDNPPMLLEYQALYTSNGDSSP